MPCPPVELLSAATSCSRDSQRRLKRSSQQRRMPWRLWRRRLVVYVAQLTEWMLVKARNVEGLVWVLVYYNAHPSEFFFASHRVRRRAEEVVGVAEVGGGLGGVWPLGWGAGIHPTRVGWQRPLGNCRRRRRTLNRPRKTSSALFAYCSMCACLWACVCYI